MAMTILNNTGAMMSLGELNKNITEVGKQLARIASGQRIVGAKDGASDFAISEKMRVKLRAMGQDDINVKNGYAMLQVAAGGIQEQINLMRTIKEKVIDACNDSNSDIDRAIIQKEINQCYRELEDISVGTDYNGRRLLMGGVLSAQVVDWDRLDAPVEMADSIMDIIPNNFYELDGIEDTWFDDFTPDIVSDGVTYRRRRTGMTSIGLAGAGSMLAFSGAGNITPQISELDLSDYYTTPSQLYNVGINVGGYPFVLSNGSGNTYRNVSSAYVIDISGCATLSDAASAIAGKLGGDYAVRSNGTKVVIEYPGNRNPVVSTWSDPGGPETTQGRTGAGPTGLGRIGFSGGRDQSGRGTVDDPVIPATAASTSPVSITSGMIGKGVTVNGAGTAYVKFVSGSGCTRNSEGVWEVGTGYSGTTNLGNGINLSMSGGSMTLGVINPGSRGNGYSVSDGITGVDPVTRTYAPIIAYNGTDTVIQSFVPAGNATCRIDLSSQTNVESFIDGLVGKAFTTNYRESYYYREIYEFIDSGSTSLDSVQKIENSRLVDVNALRNGVAGGIDLPTAFFSLLRSSGLSATLDGTTLVINSMYSGPTGDNERLYAYEGELHHYDVDFTDWFAANTNIPEDLDGKGFRAYCATDADQWFNFSFVNDASADSDRPESGNGAVDIKTIIIDVAGVTDAASLARAIYDQGLPQLNRIDHFMKVAYDEERPNVVTLYDERPYNTAGTPQNGKRGSQERGAKITDGVLDDLVRTVRNLYVEDLVIQHTEKQNQNIHVLIPRTTLDHVFGFLPGAVEMSDFNVLTKGMRDRLLGTDENRGILDRGIEYLLDASALVGAQTSRLTYAGENIATQNENLTASESVIRDADMAKEMLAFTKSQILSQGSQGMLAQANQNAASVLGLLQ